MPWLVTVAKPNHEAIAATHLRRQGFDYWYPQFLLIKPGKKPQIRPLFPRYLFIHQGLTWRSLTGTRGISYVIMGESGPQTLQDTVIETLKARCDHMGLYQLAKPPKFTRGTKVKCETGPFAGIPLIYEGMLAHERVNCLAEIMGRATLIECDEAELIAA